VPQQIFLLEPAVAELEGRLGNEIVQESEDDSYRNVDLGFNFKFFGNTYYTLYPGSNTYITAGGGSGQFSSLSLDGQPPLPGIHLGTADNSWQRVWSYFGPDETPDYWKIRYEGTASTSGTQDNPNIIYEATYFNPSLTGDKQFIEVVFGVHSRIDRNFGVTTGSQSSENRNGGVINDYMSYVFESDTEGRNWRILEGYSVGDEVFGTPVAVVDTLSATEDASITYLADQLLRNDTDVDTSATLLTISSVTSGTGGTVVLNNDGTVTFTPIANFNGNANFTYAVSDSTLVSQPTTVTVNVGPVNDEPAAIADTLSATEDTAVTYTTAQLLGNDTDVDTNTTLTIATVTSGTGGTVVLNNGGTVTFTPSANFNGAANFSYTVSDGTQTSNSATVTVSVSPVNDAPQINTSSEPVQTSVGSSAYSSGWTDTAPGNAYIQETPSGNTGTVTQWKFFKPHTNDGRWVTPVIYEKTASNTFIVRGIGRSRSASGPAGVYTFDFDLVAGSAVFANGNYTYGHIDKYLSGSGDTGTSTTGSVATVGSGTWGFINTQNPVTTIGGEQSLGYRIERHYASELIISSGGGSRVIGSVVEAGQNDDGSLLAGIISDSSTLTASDPDSATLRWSITGSPSNRYGSIAINAETGVWTYTLDNGATASEGLAEGGVATELFTARVSDENGAYDEQTISVTIFGTNDKPLILTNTGSSATSDFSFTTADWSHGSLNSSSTWGSFLGTFGNRQNTTKTFSESSAIKAISFDWLRLDSWDGEHFKIKANGVEIFSRIFALYTNVTTTSSGATAGYGWTLTPHEYGNYWGESGWSDQKFTILITPPEGIKELTLELSSNLDEGASNEAWGIDNFEVETQGSTTSGTVTEEGSADDGSVIQGTSSVSGTIFASDPDSATLRWSITGSAFTRFGSIAIDADTGVWTYTLDNDASATQELTEDENFTETFIARVSDEHGVYDEKTISVTINGTNDAPIIVNNPGSSALSDFSSTTSGWSQGSLVNTSTWGSFLGTFGARQITSKTFSESSTIEAISFDWLRLDSWDGEHFKIKANGIEIFSSGFSLGTNVTSTSSGATAGYGWTLTPLGYGNYWGNSGWNDQKFTIRITPPEGINQLTLELSSTLNQEASDEAWGIDNVVVETQGSTTSGTVTEAGTADNGSAIQGTSYISGIISATDADAGERLSWSIAESPSTIYGSFALESSTGRWSYELNNTLLATQALSEGDTVDETFVARATDVSGASVDQVITITIHGTNDQPLITSTETNHQGYLSEAGHSAGGVVDSGSPSVFGELTAADVDANSQITWSVIGLVDDTYGTFSIDTESGEWSYALDNSKTAVQALFAEDTRTVTYTARVTDQYGAYSEQAIEITINGANDIVRQFADHVIAVSSEGQAGGGDRWTAVQALGAPDTNSYADLDTAWSPRERNASGGAQAEEHLELGFRRPVRATGFVIHETFGKGFVRRVDAIDTSGNVHLLWSGIDSSASEISAFSISLDQPTDYLVHGLKIWVDIDHTSDWEQIDAVELIGWATQETYKPLAPTLDQVAGNDVVNAAEKAAGLVLSGTAEANSTIELSWGNILHTGLTGSDRRWSIAVRSLDIPEDSSNSSLSIIAIDTEGYRSNPHIKSVRINSAAPLPPQINTIAGDNRINIYEKSVGVTLQGTAEGAAVVELNWGGVVSYADVNSNGTWSTLIGGQNGQGVIPQDASVSVVSVVAVNADGNRSDQSRRDVVIDTSVPISPLLNIVSADNIINAAEKKAGVFLSGTAEAGTAVNVQWGTLYRSSIVNAAGLWSVLVAKEFVPEDDARSLIRLQATDIVGNLSSFTRELVHIDTTAPSSPLINQVSTDDILNAKEAAQGVLLTGSAEQGSLIEVDWNNRHFTTSSNTSGRWTLRINHEYLPTNGSSTAITTTATDAAGNRSEIASRPILIDLEPPDAPILNPVGQNGVVNAKSKALGIILSGTAEAGTSITLNWGRIEKQVVVDSLGIWSAEISSSEIPSDGLTAVKITAVDLAGNHSMTVSQDVVVDTTPPRAPKFIGSISSDGAISGAERNAGVFIRGTTDAGSTVSISFAGLTKDATVAGSNWQAYFTSSEIPIGLDLKKAVTAVATDAALNSSAETTIDVVLNTAAPLAPTINAIANDDIVNGLEAASGLVVTGTSQSGNLIKISVGTKSSFTTADKDGLWALVLTRKSLPIIDGVYSLIATAANKSGDTSPSTTRSFQLDQTPPELLSSFVNGTTLVLEFSKQLQTGQFSSSQFVLREGRRSLQVERLSISDNEPNKLYVQPILPIASSSDLSFDYIPNSLSNQIKDVNGNLLSSFSKLTPTTLNSSTDVNSLAASYIRVNLLGDAHARLVGNSKNNVINGNGGDNLISGGDGADVLTGGGGRDVFRLNGLSESLLGTVNQPRFDRITDFAIGTDVVDAPVAVSRGQVVQRGSINTLNQTSITNLLAPSQFPANSASVFSFTGGATERWFLALNDSSAGFSITRDAIIEITGFTGQLANLQIV